jgi:hypothetical protein
MRRMRSPTCRSPTARRSQPSTSSPPRPPRPACSSRTHVAGRERRLEGRAGGDAAPAGPGRSRPPVATSSERESRLQLAVDDRQQQLLGRERSIVERGESLDRLSVGGGREPQRELRRRAGPPDGNPRRYSQITKPPLSTRRVFRPRTGSSSRERLGAFSIHSSAVCSVGLARAAPGARALRRPGVGSAAWG